MGISINANQSAFLTVSALAAATAASCYAAVTVASTAAAIAFAVLGITAAGASGAAITAWLDKDSLTARAYFSKFQEHAGIAVASAYQLVAQTLISGLIKGIVDGIRTVITRKIAGPDRTYAHVQ